MEHNYFYHTVLCLKKKKKFSILILGRSKNKTLIFALHVIFVLLKISPIQDNHLLNGSWQIWCFKQHLIILQKWFYITAYIFLKLIFSASGKIILLDIFRDCYFFQLAEEIFKILRKKLKNANTFKYTFLCKSWEIYKYKFLRIFFIKITL